MALNRLQTATGNWLAVAEEWLQSERDQLPLWLPVWLGTGIAVWFLLPDRAGWTAAILAGLGVAFSGLLAGWMSRLGRSIFWVGIAFSLGCALVWWRADRVAAPFLSRPIVATIAGRVDRAEAKNDGEGVRATLTLDPAEGMPRRIRLSFRQEQLDEPLHPGDRIEVRARLMPPPGAAIPGSHDFARIAWFQQIGGTGTALDPPRRTGGMTSDGPSLRERLSSHVRSRLEGSAGGIAAALASGDRAGIASEDEEAMRASGLTHLLSISGLHITAVVGAAMLLTLRLLALSPWLALRWPLMLISAGVGAAAGIGYTVLTGAEVPTIRSCIAALLVLCGLALGREAMTLRLVATGALIVLLVWPESLVGPSFQLSFAAITAIVALHELPWVKAVTHRREEGIVARLLRVLLALLLTGLAVELVLAPIALFHFHKSGVYGALANIVAIPLTTFIIMPAEALALVLDLAGAGDPFWWIAGLGLDLLLWIARTVAGQPGAVATLPTVPVGAFALMIAGGLWLLLWRTKARVLGIAPFFAGAIWAVTTPEADVLLTGDGRHLAVRGDEGEIGLLRPRAGDYVREMLAGRSGEVDPLPDLDSLPGARCGPDMCLVEIRRNGRTWRIAATRSRHFLPWKDFIQACAHADIVASDRRLPQACQPRWLKADRSFLAGTGGLAINLASGTVETVRQSGDSHPWIAEADDQRPRDFQPDQATPAQNANSGQGAGR